MTAPDSSPRIYRFADLTLDTGRRGVLRRNETVDIGALNFDLLRVLVESAPNIVTADDLAEKVWGRHFVSPENVSQRIMLLRQRLSDSAARPRYIETVRNKGYRLIPEVEAMSRAQAPAPAAPRRLGLIAVLPFDSLSASADDAFFAAGLHNEVLSQLAKLRSLRVISRTSVQRYARDRPSIAEIAAELGAGAIVEASVRYAGTELMVTAQLIDADTDTHVWTGSFRADRSNAREIFGIQIEIATAIASALGTEITTEDRRRLDRAPTDSTSAYAFYLRAVSLSQQPGFNSGERIHVLVDRALELDDGFASAYALKALAYVSSLTNNVVGDAVTAAEWPEVERRVRDSANRALALDPFEPNARDALRQINIATWNWKAYEQGLERRDEDHLRFQPLWVVSWMGKHEQAVRAGQRSVLLNPNDAGAEYSLGSVYGYSGDFESARQKFVRAAELSPDDALVRALIAYNAIARGDNDLASKELQLVEKLLGRNRLVIFLAEIAYSYSRIGRQADAERLYKEIEALGDSAVVGVGTWALASLAVGDTAGALRWLEAAAEKARKHQPDQGLVSLMNLRMNFLADPLLEQPQFADVLSRIRGS